MKKTTLLALVVLVAGLWFLSRRQSEEVQSSTAFQFPLAEGFQASEAVSLRIDHLKRGTPILLERDSEGSWFLTEPLAYPARGEVVRQLLRQLSVAQGILIDRPDLSEFGLDPPQLVLEVEQADVQGTGTITRRFEFGDFDVEPTRMYIRAVDHSQGEAGAILRGPRSLFSYLDYSVNDLRETRLTDLTGRNVVSFRRRGRVDLPELGGEIDLGLDALLEHGGWRRVDEPKMGLDPGVIGTLARAAAELRATGFLADGREYFEHVGLDPPAFEVELFDELGQQATLLFGRTSEGDDSWCCVRQGSDAVAYVSARDIHLLAQPAENLYDYRVFRGLRDDIERIELTLGERTLVVERDESDWWVRQAGRADRFGADHGEVADMLSAFEKAELGAFLEETFEPVGEDGQARAWRVRSRAGVEWGGRIGARTRDADSGAEGWQFQRAGDELIAILGEDLVRVVELSLDDLRRKLLFEVAENAIDQVRIVRGTEELSFRRGGDNGDRWFPGDLRTPLPVDSPFFAVLEELKRPLAESWLDAETDTGTDPIEVTLRGSFLGGERSFLVAAGEAGSSQVRLDRGQLAVLDRHVHPRLHQALAELFAP